MQILILTISKFFSKQYLFSGLILGWGSAVFIFKEEGFFFDECESGYEHKNEINKTCAVSCPSQDAHFNVIIQNEKYIQ